MELEVRLVGGIESCFVSLPLHLIQTLQSAVPGGALPPLLALDLLSRDGDSWKLAWSGAASTSRAIEVSRHFAECISLVDSTNVRVKVVATLPKAVFVTVEPDSEEDWEILELNSDLAENAILKQVGVVHEGMRFPLWLHGHTVVLFRVVSVSPEKPVVQLVPGTEVAVTPKTRKTMMDSPQQIKKSSSSKGRMGMKALLRVQVPMKRVVHIFEYKDFELGVLLTSVAFIHPETARNSLFDNLHIVSLIPRLSMNETMRNHKDGASRSGSNLATEESMGTAVISKETASRNVMVRLLFTDTVAKGHVMLPQSLQLFLSVNTHSWVYVKGCTTSPRNDLPMMRLSPCRFKLAGKRKSTENGSSYNPEDRKNSKSKNLPPSVVSLTSADTMDWSLHEELLTSLWCKVNENTVPKMFTTREIKYLICVWLVGQIKAMASYVDNNETSVNSVVLTDESLFHFEIMSNNFRNRRHQLSPGLPFEKNSTAGESTVELLYLLTTVPRESSSCGPQNIFEISLDVDDSKTLSPQDFQLITEKLEFGEPVSLSSVIENSARSFSTTVSSLSWMERAISQTIGRLSVLLSPTSRKLLDTFNLPPPGHVLIYGPSGSGRTSLSMAIANYFEQHEDILAHIIFVSCSKLALEKNLTIRQTLNMYISEALDHSPSLMIFDDLDTIVSTASELEGSQTSNATIPLVEFLIDIMDELGESGQDSCGIGPIAFMASAQAIAKLPQSLCSSGRFDFHIQLPAPAVSERGAILKHEVHKRSLECSEDILSDIASKCDGYDAYDLEILVDRAVHAATSRFLLPHIVQENTKPTLVREDFSQAMCGFVPVAMRGLTKAASEGGHSGWEDVGGLTDIQKAIEEMVELPSKFPNIFTQAPLRLRSNVLLYGPPGCGKTHIVGAAAAACSLRFISIKGPELLNKYIGASEQAVRDLFAKAAAAAPCLLFFDEFDSIAPKRGHDNTGVRDLFAKAAAAAPCLLFFDEFDSIAPKRGHDNTGVTDRVVNQLLTELDGVESLTGVFVFAATSRPDLIDAALLRPGRLDRLLFCDFPSWQERLDILKVLSRKLPLASDVSLETIASMTEGFSGADLQALLSDSQLASVHEFLDSNGDSTSRKMPVIGDELMRSVTSRARPSVSEAEKHRLYKIYNQFLDSKKSVNAQSRDAKGKRATLA